MRACDWRYKTGRVPTHPVPLNPDTRMQICEELAEQVENFLEVMKDEPNTNNKPTRLLERDMSAKEAIGWLNKFEAYYKNKEKDLPNRGYQPCIQGRMVLNSYIDRHLEDKLDHDVPPGGGTEIIGEQGCTTRLREYFTKRDETGSGQTPVIELTPTWPVFTDERMKIIDLAGGREDYSGRFAAQAREHEQFKRKKGYTFEPTDQNDPRLWHIANSYHPKKKDANNNEEAKGKLTELPREVLEIICLHLPFRALQNLKRTARRLRKFIEESKKIYESISITGEHLDEAWLSDILIKKYLDISRGELDEVNGTIDNDMWSNESSLSGICLSGFRKPYIPIAAMVSTLTQLTTLDMSYSCWELVGEVSRALEGRTEIQNVNVGTGPYMQVYHHENTEPVRWTLARIIKKCPNLQNIILHGLEINSEDLNHIQKHLPATVEGIDLARNPVRDADIKQLTTRCPNLTFLDVSETMVTYLILTDISTAWGHSLAHLSLPNTVARKTIECTVTTSAR